MYETEKSEKNLTFAKVKIALFQKAKGERVIKEVSNEIIDKRTAFKSHLFGFIEEHHLPPRPYFETLVSAILLY